MVKFKNMNANKQEELNYKFKEYLADAKHHNDLALIELEGIYNATKSNDHEYLTECQEAYLAECNKQLIALNNANKIIQERI